MQTGLFSGTSTQQTDDTVLFCRTQTGLAANHLWWTASLCQLRAYIYICLMTPCWHNALRYSQPITHMAVLKK